MVTSRTAHAIRIRIHAAGDGTVGYAIEDHRRVIRALYGAGPKAKGLSTLPDAQRKGTRGCRFVDA